MQLQTDLYKYVKQEILSYRRAGVMPDLVAIGNEVDTGFLGPSNRPTSSNFENFATLQKEGLQAVLDAAADSSIDSVSGLVLLLSRRTTLRIYLKYELGVIPKAFLNMEVKALGVS